MAAWDQVPLSAPATFFGQKDYAATMADILSSPGATLRKNQESDRDYAAKMQQLADLRTYQQGTVGAAVERNQLTKAGQGPAGPWGTGGGLDAKDSNILWAGSQPGGDPTSVEYQQAYARAIAPKWIPEDDGTGQITWKPQYPIIPPGIKKPGGGSAAPAPDGTTPPPVTPTAPAAPAPDGTTPAPVASNSPLPTGWPQPPSPVSNKKKTEAENRASSRLVMGRSSYEAANANWDALAEQPGMWASFGKNIATSIGGAPGVIGTAGANAVMSDRYQQAATAVANLAQSYLYAMSGANAPEEEHNRIIAAVMPAVGDKPGQIAAKKHTMEIMKQALEAQAGMGVNEPPPIDAKVAVDALLAKAAAEGGGGADGGPAPAGGADTSGDQEGDTATGPGGATMVFHNGNWEPQ